LLGTAILLVLVPIGFWVTRSSPNDVTSVPETFGEVTPPTDNLPVLAGPSVGVSQAIRSASFWLLLIGSTLAIGTIGAVIQHFILFLKDIGYSAAVASQYSTILLAASLAGRVIVGHLADRFRKSYMMAFFYFLIGASVFLLSNSHSSAILGTFALVFGFSMGADYMLIPLVTAECFGTTSLGKLLALIIMGYSIGQWAGPWFVGKIFDARHTYDLAWTIIAIAAVTGAAAIYSVPFSQFRSSPKTLP
jgi:MFS family permease